MKSRFYWHKKNINTYKMLHFIFDFTSKDSCQVTLVSVFTSIQRTAIRQVWVILYILCYKTLAVSNTRTSRKEPFYNVTRHFIRLVFFFIMMKSSPYCLDRVIHSTAKRFKWCWCCRKFDCCAGFVWYR